jgi:CheY-like chemotaxis protein
MLAQPESCASPTSIGQSEILQNLNLPATSPQPSFATVKSGTITPMTILYSERRRILLIDDNSRRLNLLATVLRNREVEVHLANRLVEATSLWKNIPYDLVLLAASENSEQATLASLHIRKSNPRQRIALLVGPPAYIREIARPTAKPKFDPPVSTPAASDETSSRAQWPEIVQKVVSDWYVDQSARLRWTS